MTEKIQSEINIDVQRLQKLIDVLRDAIKREMVICPRDKINEVADELQELIVEQEGVRSEQKG